MAYPPQARRLPQPNPRANPKAQNQSIPTKKRRARVVGNVPAAAAFAMCVAQSLPCAFTHTHFPQALSEKVDPQKLVSARGPPTRSPDPPARVIKSTHGGNLFTADDVQYLKAYIEYCQHQGLVLSLREICERLAVKAPHHTFYSWRRYCNKHQIRLGAYTMDDPTPDAGPSSSTLPQHHATATHQLAAPSSSAAGTSRPSAVGLGRTDRSPTPPRALYRSTTGKGIAFTETDVTFLMRFLTYRRRKNQELDMVQFWKDVAERVSSSHTSYLDPRL